MFTMHSKHLLGTCPPSSLNDGLIELPLNQYISDDLVFCLQKAWDGCVFWLGCLLPLLIHF